MKRLTFWMAAVLAAAILPASVAARSQPPTTVSASPSTVAVGGTVRISWENLPTEGQMILGVSTPCVTTDFLIDPATTYLDYALQVCGDGQPAVGTYQVIIQQDVIRPHFIRTTIVATTSFTVTP
jgi:hypothetical protein